MIHLPSDQKALLPVALDIIEICRSSQATRAAYYRTLNAIAETGRQDGTRSLINKLHAHLDRLAAHLFSPTDLRFAVDFENQYPPNILAMGHEAARILTRDWERNNTDMVFAQGVFEALKFGSCFMKQWVQSEGPDSVPIYQKSLVMPWQFGVYTEDINDLSRQSAMCETVMLTLPEVWRRISHLPNAQQLYRRIKSHVTQGTSDSDYNSFFHQILSSAQLQTGVTGATKPIPGGIVALNNDPNYAMIGPEVAAPRVRLHELWVQDEKDYTTIQIIEPDILIAPLFKKSNLLIPGDNCTGLHPYTLIQANEVAGYLWGRSELSDLIEPQSLLSTWADDARRLFGLQIDKIMGFSGYDGLTDEVYDASRAAGFFNAPPGANMQDLTPSFPPQTLDMLNLMMRIIDNLGGFDNILSGSGEPGVRAGNHADTLMKTASPRLRDRSLLVERQCAAAADLRLSLMEAKDGRGYWTDGSSLEAIEKSRFVLSDMPEDRRVCVDSHSGSPIFADDHQQLVAFGVKAGFIDGHSAIDMLPFPQKDQLQIRLKAAQAQQAKLMEELKKEYPEEYAKLISHGKGGHH